MSSKLFVVLFAVLFAVLSVMAAVQPTYADKGGVKPTKTEQAANGSQTTTDDDQPGHSKPDSNGKGPERSDETDPDAGETNQHSNNGCGWGNEPDRTDDNEGWCGQKPKASPTPKPSVTPTTTPCVGVACSTSTQTPTPTATPSITPTPQQQCVECADITETPTVTPTMTTIIRTPVPQCPLTTTVFVTNTVYVERTDSSITQIAYKPAVDEGPNTLPVTGGQIGFKATDGLLFIIIGVGATLLVQGTLMRILGLTIVRQH